MTAWAQARARQALEAETMTTRPGEAGHRVAAELGLVTVRLMICTPSESEAAAVRFGRATLIERFCSVWPAPGQRHNFGGQVNRACLRPVATFSPS